MMKKFKFLLGSAAFLVAVGGAFASKNVEGESQQQFYDRQNPSEECRPSPCSPFVIEGIVCEFDVWDNDQCSDPNVGETRRPE